MNCPYCKEVTVPTPLGMLCVAKTNEKGRMCGTTLGDSEQVRKEVKV
jgi:hypothetical protein